jgi:hypothetical protein
MESYSASVKLCGGLKLQSFETPKVLAYAKISKLACTPFAAVGGNKEGVKKCNMSCSATSPTCNASMQKENRKKRSYKESGILFPLHNNLVFLRILAHIVLNRDDIG